MSLLSYPNSEAESSVDSVEDVQPVSDAELLTQFLKLRNEAAFSIIVHRYGQLVFGVALRIVRDRHTAEDVTQATFLLLAKSAKKIKRRESLSSWLHGAAIRLARKAIKRRSHEQVLHVVTEEDIAESSFAEIQSTFEQQVLDEELDKLPAQYRDPLVLHFLQGKTYAETAELLGVTIGAIEGRMKRGKRELQIRLTKRGVSLGAAIAALGWSQSTASAALQPQLVHTIAQNSVAAFQGTAFTAACSPEAVYLAGKELTMLTTTKIAAIFCSLAVATGVGWLGHDALAQFGGTTGQGNQQSAIQTETPFDSGSQEADALSGDLFADAGGYGQGLSTGEQQQVNSKREILDKLRELQRELRKLQTAKASDPFAPNEFDLLKKQAQQVELMTKQVDQLLVEILIDLEKHPKNTSYISGLDMYSASGSGKSSRFEMNDDTLYETVTPALATNHPKVQPPQKVDEKQVLQNQLKDLQKRLEELQGPNNPHPFNNSNLQEVFDHTKKIEKVTQQIHQVLAELARLDATTPSPDTGGLGTKPVDPLYQGEYGMDMEMMGGMGDMSGMPQPWTKQIAVERNQSPAEEKIEEALDSANGPMEFIDLELRDAIDFFAQSLQIPVLIDEQALTDIGFTTDEPINFMIDAKSITNRDALELMLSSLDLTYVIKNSVLVITSIEEASTQTETRVYDVRPLQIQDPLTLQDVLTKTVAPDSWAVVGGNGELSFLNGSMIVIQSQDVHDKIEVLLNQLSKQVQANPNSPTWPVWERNHMHGGKYGGALGGGMQSGMGGGGGMF